MLASPREQKTDLNVKKNPDLEKNKSASRPLAGRKSRTRKMARELRIARLRRELMQNSGRVSTEKSHRQRKGEKWNLAWRWNDQGQGSAC
jgi:hypothetical protein